MPQDEVHDQGGGEFEMKVQPLLCINCGEPILNMGDPPVWTHVSGSPMQERGIYCDDIPICDDETAETTVAEVATPPEVH